MKKRTIGLIAITLVVLCGISGLFLVFVNSVPVWVSYLPVMSGAMLSAAERSHAPALTLLSELGSCCICIPIPLVFGLFALSRQVNNSVAEEPLSPASSDS